MGILTNSQKSIWVTEQYYRGSSINNICGTAIIEESVDFGKLRKSIEIVRQKHDNFRLQLNIDDGEVKQVLSKPKEIKIDIIDVADPKELEEIRKEIVRTPFKLENSQLFKFYIFKFENGEGAFMLNIHHLIADAWTLAFICNEIIKTYSALKQNKEVETKAIYSYIDYIKSEQEYQKSEKYQKDKTYWEEQFKIIPEVATIPGSIENADEANPEGERKQFNLDSKDVEKIKEYCKQNKISLYNFFMAVYAIYIGEISNLDEFVIGTPILNRTNFKEKNSAGMFINMAPFKINMSQETDFKEFTKNIAIGSINMLKHQKYSYQCLLENLREKNNSVPNLYNILLSYQITNAQMSGGDVKYKTEWTFNGCCAENMDIQIYDLNDTGSLNIAYDYKTSIYEEKDIENLHKRILNIIKQVISKQEIKIKDIEIVTPEEKEKLVSEFNKTELGYDHNIPIIKYFEEQAKTTPENIAIVFENKKMTYKELNEKANSLAYELRKNGVTNNTIIGILQERSFEMMIAILAVLKSGGSYIPIAPDYPKERIEYMLQDSNASILLTSSNSKINKKIINIKLNSPIYDVHKENLENISKPDDLSYLIYTSGSTGTPKGVMLKQENLSNFYNSMKETIDYLKDGKQHKILSITTVSFDIFAFESLMSLTRGLTVYMTNENEQKMTSELERIIKENKVEVMQTTPSIMKFHLENVKNKENLQSLKYIMLAGEPLTKILVDKIKSMIPEVTIYNGYGPSETTIFSTTANVTNQSKITIGRPVHNTQIYILNKNKKVVPQGTVGEIYISGDGVGKGYMNKDEQTKASFIPNPFITGKTMYKVGDLGAYDENGEITCYGRVDNQIKIRGLRVELPEIERQMLSIYNIANAVVVKKEINGRDALCAYYTQNGPVEETVIKTVLQNKLPQYMVPQYFVKLERIPYTPNGKIDKKALPMPDLQEKAKEKIEIRNDIDKELLQIVQKMMHLSNVSLSDTLLDLGGDSLTAITLSTKISSKFNVQVYIKDIMSNKTLKEISDIIRENQAKGFAKIKIEKTPEKEAYPLSSAQKRIYYNSKMIGDNNIVYNLPGGILVDEILDKEKVKNVFKKIIERHSTLRTSFVVQDNDVVQKIKEKIEFEIPIYQNAESEIQEIIAKFSKPFNLEKEPLFRAELHYINNEKTLLLVESHHIVMDGTSLNNLIIEFERLYNGANLKRIPIQYKDYAVWENKFNESEAIKKYEDYWVNKFKNSEFSELNLPYDYKISANRSYTGKKVSNVIDERQFRKIERYAKRIGVSPYVLFISAFFILLYKYTGQEEIILGSPIANRDINETKRMIGMFVNNIVVKANINSEATFQEFINVMKEQILDDLSNQPYPFDMLVKKLGIKGDNSRNPLFDVMFTYQNKEENILKLYEKETQVIEIDNGIAKFNLSLEIKPKIHTINVEYCTDLFKEKTIQRLFEHYMNVINSVMENNNVKIKDIEITSEKEKNKILYEFNDTKTEYPRGKTVAQLFEEQVEKTPEKIAVVFEDQKLTYKELNEKANQLANYIKKQHVNVEDTIAILLDKSLEMIIAILAILKNGCTYLPIDIGYPKERKEYILKDSNAKLLLTSKKLKQEDLLVKSIYIDLDTENTYSVEKKQNLDYQGRSTDLAYIMYTSGSTGKPKGVMVENKSIVRLVKNTNYIEFKEDDRILQTGSIVFDACTLEIWGALLNGLELYIIKKEDLLDASILQTYILKNKITVLWLTAPLFNQLCEENPHMFRTVRCVLSGGDVLSCKHVNMVRTANPNLTIINGYGPTENTTFSCCYHIEKDYKQSIPIGKPIANSTAYVVSKDGNLQPIGIPGELWVGGDGVAKGYVNNSVLTKEKFIENSFGTGKIYKTGDLTKWNEDGNIEFLGRIDSQIKIRGFRVELSEITTMVSEFDGIKEAYTIFKEVNKEKAICTYIVGKTQIETQKLKEYLSKFLPQYMVPKYIVQMEKLPKNQNGKIDKNLLPEIAAKKEKNREIVLPANEREEKISNIFKEVLGLNEINIDDNFFEWGGDSISAMRLQLALLNNNLDIKYGDIFKYPTIKEIADQAKDIKNNKIIKKYPKAEYYPISSAQKRMYLSSSMDKYTKLYNITGGIIMDSTPNIDKLQKALDIIVDRQESLRTYFENIDNIGIVQKIKDKLNLKIEVINAKTNDIDEIFNEYQTTFDLSKAPLFKVFLFTLPNKKALLMLDIHHIIFDGASLKIFLREISDLYNGNNIEKNCISYKDFAIWENEQLNNNELDDSKKFWIKQFDTDIPILNMPTTYPRPAQINYPGDTYIKEIPIELTEKIEKLARENDVTPYMIMLASYYILLYKYTGQEDIIIGTPVSGRIYNELNSVLGMFVNSLPLRKQISSKSTFKAFLNEVKNYCVDCFEHQNYPFDLLVKDLKIQKDNRNPLFDTMFIYQNNGFDNINLDKIKAKQYIPKSTTSKFDISLEVVPTKNKMSLFLEYRTDLFDSQYIKRLANHYYNILETVTDNLEVNIENISILDEIEKNKILYEFNNHKLPYSKEKSIVQLFEEQVTKTPNNIALIFEEQRLTFEELNRKANQLAEYLIKNGIKENSTVGIMLPRSIEILVAIIAVLKTGGCYIPIDPTLPEKRINYMLSNSNVSTILVNNPISTKIKARNILNIKIDNKEIYVGKGKNLNKSINPESPSYMIYTSGSTGIPKGVELNHKALANLANYLNNTVEFLKDEYSNIAMCSITTISFDIFLFETLICLQRGLKIVIANEEEQNTPNLLDKLIEKNNVKAIQMTPSRMYIFINNKDIMPHLNNLDYIVLAGEALPKDLLKQILNINHNAKVYNGYGPSETTVFATFTDVTKYDDITIGKPITNTRIYILDKDKNICPIGIPGELYIAGDGIGIGYSNNEKITNERFIKDKFYPNERMYKTGDLAKYLPNGEIHYIGRIDNQIKIRGLRIELDEIEKCILKYPNIEKCIIAPHVDTNNRQFIVAYLLETDRVSINKLKAFLKTMLPKYMIPSYFVILDKIPYLNNGKIDKKSLPEPDMSIKNVKNVKYIPPKNKTEIELVEIFQNLLSISPIGIDDNFFELGGDSLLAINLQVELLKKNFNITYSDIFMNPTVRELENFIVENKHTKLNGINSKEFYEIDKMLKSNCKFSEELKYTPVGNILITGTTGFLGAHVLKEFLENEKGTAYCLIRSEAGLNVKNKLKNKLHFYFGEIYDKLIDERIVIVNADMIEENIGMEEKDINNLFNNISCVINCAAKVSHYGNYNDYKLVNVVGTENLLKLCLKFKKKFYQISTLSISGNQLVNKTDENMTMEQNYLFKENDFYINQTLNNVYVKSKFEAEKLVFKYILNGLDGYILRVGNLMNRYLDGKFQPNVDENASINRIISITNIGCIPDYITNINLEFTPVDSCAKAIMKLIQHSSKNNRVFHLYDHNYITIKRFIEILKTYTNIDIVSEKSFTNRIDDMLKQEDANRLLSGILRDLDSNRKILKESKIKLNSDFTIEYLSKIGFEWPDINEKYLKQFLDYFVNKGYINKREEKI